MVNLFGIVCFIKSNVSIFNCLTLFKNWLIFSFKSTNNFLFDDDVGDIFVRWIWLRKKAPISGLHDSPSCGDEIVFRWRIVCKPGNTS